MTRAADRLIVCGAEGKNKRPDGCWYDLVREPLEPFLVEEADGEDKVLRYRKTPAAGRGARTGTAAGAEKPDRRALPSWLRETAPAEAPRAGPLSPSSAFDEEIGAIAARAGVRRPSGKRRCSAAASCIG